LVAVSVAPSGDRCAEFALSGTFTALVGRLLRVGCKCKPVSDLWWPPTNGQPSRWRRYQVNPFTASVTAITPERAQELAGRNADLHADMDP
jgi:hypothetical protein